MSFPRISIVIPSFNKVQFIRETLGSIVSQKYPNLEVIIQDGGSTDGTLAILKEYAIKYPKIFTLESKKDNGQLDAINKGMEKVKGEILTFINADDIYEPNAFFTLARYYQRYPKALWFAGRGKVVDKNGKEISEWITKYKNILLNLNRYSLLLMVNYLMQPSVFITKKAYKKFAPFTGIGRTVLEYDLWLKLGKVRMPEIINEDLSSFRLYREGLSISSHKELLSAETNILQRYTNSKILLRLHNFHNNGRIKLSRYY